MACRSSRCTAARLTTATAARNAKELEFRLGVKVMQVTPEAVENSRVLLYCSSSVPSCSQKCGRFSLPGTSPLSTLQYPPYPPGGVASAGVSQKVAA